MQPISNTPPPVVRQPPTTSETAKSIEQASKPSSGASPEKTRANETKATEQTQTSTRKLAAEAEKTAKAQALSASAPQSKAAEVAKGIDRGDGSAPQSQKPAAIQSKIPGPVDKDTGLAQKPPPALKGEFQDQATREGILNTAKINNVINGASKSGDDGFAQPDYNKYSAAEQTAQMNNTIQGKKPGDTGAFTADNPDGLSDQQRKDLFDPNASAEAKGAARNQALYGQTTRPFNDQGQRIDQSGKATNYDANGVYKPPAPTPQSTVESRQADEKTAQINNAIHGLKAGDPGAYTADNPDGLSQQQRQDMFDPNASAAAKSAARNQLLYGRPQ